MVGQSNGGENHAIMNVGDKEEWAVVGLGVVLRLGSLVFGMCVTRTWVLFSFVRNL